MIPTLHIHLLGDFLLMSGDTPVTTVTVSRVQSLLAYLLLHRAAPQDRSHLAFLLWPDSTEAQAHTNLRKLLYQLRQAFPDVNHFLHVDNHSLQWLPARADALWTLDILEVEKALVQAEQAKQAQDTTAMRHALERAVDLYRGDLLPGCYDEWILPDRDRIRQLFFRASERLIALLEEERAYDSAIEAARRLLRHDPLHEATYRQLMRLYALRGDRAAALRVYHTSVTVFERELGTEPSQVTRAAYESLLQSDTPSTSPTSSTSSTSSTPPTSPRTPTGPLTSRGTATPLLGRKAEWHHLQEIWRKAAGGRPQIVILTGEAGIGKTRLADEMEAWVSRQGMATANAHCYAAEGRLAYAPVTTWLRTDALQTGLSTLEPAWLTEISRLVPEVLAKQPQLPRPTSMTDGWQRQRFFEALARAVLNARQPLLLLLDDLQWCDNETLEWVHYLFRFEPGVRLLLIGTVRVEETLPGHPLVAFLGALQRDGLVTEIALGPLTTTETASLAEHITGHQLDPAMSNTLYHESEGNPLFVVEMARAGTLGERGNSQQIAKSPLPLLTQPASTLPPSVQTVLATRLAQLSPQAHEVANVAAVIGREFTFSVLAQASGESDIFAMTGQQQEARQVYQDGMASLPPQESLPSSLLTENRRDNIVAAPDFKNLPIPIDNATSVASPRLNQSDEQYIWQARLLRKTASTWNLASDNPLDTFHVNAQQTFQEAERVLEQAGNRSSIEWLREWIDLQIDQLLPLRGSVDEMTIIIEKAQTIVAQYGTTEQRGQLFQAVVARDSERERYVASEESISYCRKALAEIEQTDNRSLIGFAHFVLGNRLLWAAHFDEAEEELCTAINIAEQVGNTRLLTRCLMFLPFIFRQRGLVEEVRNVVTRALAMPEARNIAIIKGHRAWVAWRDGNLAEAELYGRASLENRQDQRRVNPFQWVGVWPLIGIALAQEKITEAMNYVRMLLDLKQQPPPEQLETLLESVLHAWDTGQHEKARALLKQAVPLARELGYL